MWVKICGVRDEVTAERISQMSPDAIGLNFYHRSPRVVTRNAAIRIAKCVGDRVQRVGVFVNHPAAEIAELVEACHLDAIQLHGDESAAMIAAIVGQVREIPVFRAWRMDGTSLSGLKVHLTECQSAGVALAGCLIDSGVSGTYGGTGKTVPWNALATEYQRSTWPPMILAGGLTTDNVAEAVRAVQPWGVDVASGVESAPGIKDLDLVARFIENARNSIPLAPSKKDVSNPDSAAGPIIPG